LKIGSIVVNCRDFDGMMRFWIETLHYEPREPAKDGWVVLKDPAGAGPNISLNRVAATEPVGGNRLHLDLYTDNRPTEVDRLIKVGAKVHPQNYGKDDDFRVLEDPDGNLFCVVQKDLSKA
jgi:hypothetical protein